MPQIDPLIKKRKSQLSISGSKFTNATRSNNSSENKIKQTGKHIMIDTLWHWFEQTMIFPSFINSTTFMSTMIFTSFINSIAFMALIIEYNI